MSKLRWSFPSLPKPEAHEPDYLNRWQVWNDNHLYEKACKNCQTVNHVYTQRDNHPEYYTRVLISCRNCWTLIQFELPVN